ncbi:hypothetical protein [Brevibacillus parabrevis]|uniref:hypothetical protein n=1 Tax=Brevibacillus parabrevis TaxID=54914 RepID=UPI001137F05C|nr:hypothetical protein [Brevibacillus parabrevis]TGV29061.1 hypothetical protein EN829_041605 [Mesorhizobium sp. M00.F.Ca.ET.186.01.1.1]
MGSDFTAVFGHEFKNYDDIVFLKKELDDSVHLKKLLVSLTGGNINTINHLKWKWGYTNAHFHSNAELTPGLFVTLMFDNRYKLIIGKGLCEFSCLIGWLAFLEDDSIQKALRKICLELSKYLGNPVYLPDSYSYADYVYEGNSIHDVLQSLKKKYGLPNLNIASMYDEQGTSWESKGYYIDLFND